MALIFPTFLPKCAPGKAGTGTGEGTEPGEDRRDKETAVPSEEPADLFQLICSNTALASGEQS